MPDSVTAERVSEARSMEDLVDDLEARGMLDLVTQTCREHAILLEEVVGQRKNPPIVAARHHVWWALRTRYGWPLATIAMMWGVAHTTIAYGIRQAERRATAKRAQAKQAEAA